MSVHPVKTQISLGRCPGWSESLLGTIRPGWSESSLGTHSFCWFCHETAYVAFSAPSRRSPFVSVCSDILHFIPGRTITISWSEARPLGMHVALSSIPMSGTFFRGDFVMKTFLWPFSLFSWFMKSSCQLLATECALSTGKLLSRLAQEQCGEGNWPRPKWPKMCWRAVKQKSNQTKPKPSPFHSVLGSQLLAPPCSATGEVAYFISVSYVIVR